MSSAFDLSPEAPLHLPHHHRHHHPVLPGQTLPSHCFAVSDLLQLILSAQETRCVPNSMLLHLLEESIHHNHSNAICLAKSTKWINYVLISFVDCTNDHSHCWECPASLHLNLFTLPELLLLFSLAHLNNHQQHSASHLQFLAPDSSADGTFLKYYSTSLPIHAMKELEPCLTLSF